MKNDPTLQNSYYTKFIVAFVLVFIDVVVFFVEVVDVFVLYWLSSHSGNLNLMR